MQSWRQSVKSQFNGYKMHIIVAKTLISSLIKTFESFGFYSFLQPKQERQMQDEKDANKRLESCSNRHYLGFLAPNKTHNAAQQQDPAYGAAE